MELDYNIALASFKRFVENEKSQVFGDDSEYKLYKMNEKLIHTMDVVKDGTAVMDELGINQSIQAFGKICFLNHDIGRFPQMRLVGTYYDHELKKSGIFPVSNHGELGEMILTYEMLREQIPNTDMYDKGIKDMVRKHATEVVSDDDFDILTTTILQDKDLYDIYTKDEANKKKMLGLILQILQDIDRLDIYHQILQDRFVPDYSDKPVDPIIWRLFLDGDYLNIEQLKEQGIWNHNAGDLVRLSFINQIKLLSVVKIIYDNDMIMKLKKKRNNRFVDIAFDITQDRLERLIKDSDGVLVDAKRLNLK